MRKSRKNAGKGYGMMFHGAFGSKKEAQKKERQVHGFIQPRNIKGERRFIVMSERKNPIRRKKRNPKEYTLYKEATGRYNWEINETTAERLRIPYARRMGHASNRRMAIADVKAALRGNPMELTVMGANPHGKEITVHPGETITLRVNPTAEGIREYFTGAPVERITVRDEPHMRAGDYALLGKLLTLYVKPLRGGQVQMIEGDGISVVSDETARQLWFVGGDQDVSTALEQFSARDRGGNIYELGEARRIDYQQRKEHAPHPDQDEWQHHFGEDNGIRPIVLFDRNHKRLLLEDGDYRIETDGIIN